MSRLLSLLLGLALQSSASSTVNLPVLRLGDVVAGRMEDGDPVVETDVLRQRNADAPTVARTFRIEVAEAGPCHVELRSDFFDAYLVLRDEHDRVLAEDDDGLIGTQSQIGFEVRPGVALRIEACALRGQRGAFEVSLEAGAPVALDPREHLQAAIDDLRRRVDARTRALGPEHPNVWRSLGSLGNLVREQGDYAEARSLYERALTICEKALGPDDPEVAVILESWGNLLGVQADYAGARPLLERALAICERARGPEHPDVARLLGDLAYVLMEQGDYAETRSLLDRSLAIRERVLGPEHLDVATAVLDLAILLRKQGDYSAARPLYERSLAIREKVLGPEHLDVADALNNLGTLLYAQGDYAGVRPLFERALAIREKMLHPGHPNVAMSLNNLALLLKTQGDYAGARPLYERSLAMREEMLGPEHPDVATCLNNLAGLLQTQGDYAGARPLFERALAIREKVLGREHPNVAQILSNLGNLLQAQGDRAGARPLYERSLAICERTLGAEHPEVGKCLNNLAALLEAQGDRAGARPLYERSLAIEEKVLGPEHPEVAMVVDNIASLLQAQGDYAAARPLFERSLAIREKVLGSEHPYVTSTQNNLGMVLANLGQGEAASALLARGDASRRSSLADFMPRASEAEIRDYLATLRWQVDLVQSPSAFTGSATAACESLLGWKGQALRAARTGRGVLREQIGDVGRHVADRLHDVMAMLSRTSSDIARGDRSLDRRQLTALVDERGSLERQLNALTAGLIPEVPSWSTLRDALPENAALVDVLVQPVYEAARWADERLVTPGHWTDPRVRAWITRRDAAEPVRVDLGPVAEIDAAIHAALQVVTGGRGAAIAAPVDSGPTLRRLIWDPLTPHLDRITTVVVSPDGVLGTVPFETLKADDGHYLVEDRSFVYLTDPTDVVRMSSNPTAPSGALLAIGGVDYGRAEDVVARADGSPPPASMVMPAVASAPSTSESLPRGGWTSTWAPLEATQGEARGVAAGHHAVFPDSEDLVLSGPAGTEEQLKVLLPKYAVLHIATHGYFNPDGVPSLDEAARRDVDLRRDSPGLPQESFTDIAHRLQGYSPGLLSGLVCAGVNSGLPTARDDGYLTAEEVGWLDLSRVELVVLSACDTGLGRPQSGEGLLGLRRAFLLAGCKTVISSLWSVPDQETADLMGLFYGNLWQKHMGRHAALRAAQLEMIARNRERFDGDARPVTWGAFVLDGDWR